MVKKTPHSSWNGTYGKKGNIQSKIQRDEDLDGFLVSSAFRGQEGSITNEASGDRKQLAVLGIVMSCKAPYKKAATLQIPDHYHKYGQKVARCSICFKEPENPDSYVKSLAF